MTIAKFLEATKANIDDPFPADIASWQYKLDRKEALKLLEKGVLFDSDNDPRPLSCLAKNALANANAWNKHITKQKIANGLFTMNDGRGHYRNCGVKTFMEIVRWCIV